MRQRLQIERGLHALRVAFLLLLPRALGQADAATGMQAAAEGVGSTTNLMAVLGALLGAAGLGFLYWLYRHPEHTGYEDPSTDSRKINEAAGD